MRKVRCPKCDKFITFDETRYKEGQSLVFKCPDCNKQFGIRIKNKNNSQSSVLEEEENEKGVPVGKIVILENQFHYRQELPIYMGDNIIGRYQKGQNIQCPIESSDPSIDMHHCTIRAKRSKKGVLQFVLSDGPSYTGTFVGDEILANGEQRIIQHGTIFTMGATSAILKTEEDED